MDLQTGQRTAALQQPAAVAQAAEVDTHGTCRIASHHDLRYGLCRP